MAEEESGPEGFGREVQTLAALFYVDHRLLASPWPARFQEALDVLTSLFKRVGLRTNVEKWSA